MSSSLCDVRETIRVKLEKVYDGALPKYVAFASKLRLPGYGSGQAEGHGMRPGYGSVALPRLPSGNSTSLDVAPPALQEWLDDAFGRLIWARRDGGGARAGKRVSPTDNEKHVIGLDLENVLDRVISCVRDPYAHLADKKGAIPGRAAAAAAARGRSGGGDGGSGNGAARAKADEAAISEALKHTRPLPSAGHRTGQKDDYGLVSATVAREVIDLVRSRGRTGMTSEEAMLRQYGVTELHRLDEDTAEAVRSLLSTVSCKPPGALPNASEGILAGTAYGSADGGVGMGGSPPGPHIKAKPLKLLVRMYREVKTSRDARRKDIATSATIAARRKNKAPPAPRPTKLELVYVSREAYLEEIMEGQGRGGMENGNGSGSGRDGARSRGDGGRGKRKLDGCHNAPSIIHLLAYLGEHRSMQVALQYATVLGDSVQSTMAALMATELLQGTGAAVGGHAADSLVSKSLGELSENSPHEKALGSGAHLSLSACTPDMLGNTALHIVCARYGADPSLQRMNVILLLRCGADVNAVNNDGATALHLAALCNQCSGVAFLLQCGAPVHVNRPALWAPPPPQEQDQEDTGSTGGGYGSPGGSHYGSPVDPRVSALRTGSVDSVGSMGSSGSMGSVGSMDSVATDFSSLSMRTPKEIKRHISTLEGRFTGAVVDVSAHLARLYDDPTAMMASLAVGTLKGDPSHYPVPAEVADATATARGGGDGDGGVGASAGYEGMVVALQENMHFAAYTDSFGDLRGGGWTPLHCAAMGGHAAAVEVLLTCSKRVRIDAASSDGRTPLGVSKNEKTRKMLRSFQNRVQSVEDACGSISSSEDGAIGDSDADTGSSFDATTDSSTDSTTDDDDGGEGGGGDGETKGESGTLGGRQVHFDVGGDTNPEPEGSMYRGTAPSEYGSERSVSSSRTNRSIQSFLSKAGSAKSSKSSRSSSRSHKSSSKSSRSSSRGGRGGGGDGDYEFDELDSVIGIGTNTASIISRASSRGSARSGSSSSSRSGSSGLRSSTKMVMGSSSSRSRAASFGSHSGMWPWGASVAMPGTPGSKTRAPLFTPPVCERSEANAMLFEALMQADETGMAMALAYGAEVTARQEQGLLAIHLAAVLGFDQFVRRLAGSGADLAGRDLNGNTALHSAISMPPEALLKAVRDIQIVDESEADVIRERHRRSPAECCTSLLALGGPVDAFNHDGAHPLHLAAECGDEEVVAVLLNHGADPFIRGRTAEGLTPLHVACAYGRHMAAHAMIVHVKLLEETKGELAMTRRGVPFMSVDAALIGRHGTKW